jgi:hypothetical protein
MPPLAVDDAGAVGHVRQHLVELAALACQQAVELVTLLGQGLRAGLAFRQLALQGLLQPRNALGQQMHLVPTHARRQRRRCGQAVQVQLGQVLRQGRQRARHQARRQRVHQQRQQQQRDRHGEQRGADVLPHGLLQQPRVLLQHQRGRRPCVAGQVQLVVHGRARQVGRRIGLAVVLLHLRRLQFGRQQGRKTLQRRQLRGHGRAVAPVGGQRQRVAHRGHQGLHLLLLAGRLGAHRQQRVQQQAAGHHAQAGDHQALQQQARQGHGRKGGGRTRAHAARAPRRGPAQPAHGPRQRRTVGAPKVTRGDGPRRRPRAAARVKAAQDGGYAAVR